MKDLLKNLLTFYQMFRFFIGLLISLVFWIVLSLVLAFFIKNDILVLIISTSFILLILILYVKNLLNEKIS